MKTLLSTIFIFFSAFVAFGQNDTTAPEIKDFSFSPLSIDVSAAPQNVVVTVHATDATGVRFMTVFFETPSGGFGFGPVIDGLHRVSGDEKDGIYSTVVTFPQTASPGTWTVSVSVSDTIGNNGYLDVAGLVSRGFPGQLQVSGSQPCTFSLNTTAQNFTASGGSGIITGTTQVGCYPPVSSNNSFITITGAGSGTTFGGGNGSFFSVLYRVGATSGAARSGTITIGGQIFTVNQSSADCAYSLDSNSQNFPASGGSGSINVTTTSGCGYSASVVSNSPFSFVAITDGASGSGSGTVNFAVTPNPGAARAITIAVAGQVFTVNQAAGATVRRKKFLLSPFNIF